MAYPRKIKNFNAFVDGTSYFGKCVEGSMPALKLKTDPHCGGGMDIPIAQDMGMEAMTAQAVFAEWAPELVTSFGRRLSMTFRAGAMGEEDFSADAFAYEIRGKIASSEGDNLKPGEASNLKLMWEVDYYRIEREGVTLIEIDPINGKRLVGGVDQLTEMRRAMGL